MKRRWKIYGHVCRPVANRLWNLSYIAYRSIIPWSSYMYFLSVFFLIPSVACHISLKRWAANRTGNGCGEIDISLEQRDRFRV